METANTFEGRAEQYLAEIANRKRNPARVNTLASYRSILRKRIIPAVGGVSLECVNNGTAKQLACRLTESGLSPASVRFAVAVLIVVMDNTLDQDAKRLYPVEWNWDFILADVPNAEPKAPTTTFEATSQAITAAPGDSKALIGLLAGSGLRIGEALALTTQADGVSNLWDSEKGTIHVRATRVRGQIQPMPKTKAGVRTVDLDPALNTFLQQSLGVVRGSLFPKSVSTYERVLKSVGIQGGFHGFRRRRETFLEEQGVVRMLMKFWTGHAAADITERYIKFGPQVAERHKKAAEVGLGFEL